MCWGGDGDGGDGGDSAGSIGDEFELNVTSKDLADLPDTPLEASGAGGLTQENTFATQYGFTTNTGGVMGTAGFSADNPVEWVQDIAAGVRTGRTTIGIGPGGLAATALSLAAGFPMVSAGALGFKLAGMAVDAMTGKTGSIANIGAKGIGGALGDAIGRSTLGGE